MLLKDNRIIIKLLMLWLLLSVYVTLHEAGHALAAYLFGGKITHFSINLFDARVGYSGNLSSLQKSIIHVAGFGLPYILWLFSIIIIPANTGKKIIENIKVHSVVIIGTLLPWIVIPILYLSGNAPPGDDVTNFLEISSFNSLLLALIFLSLLVVSFYIWWKKTKDVKKIFLSQGKTLKLSRSGFIIIAAISLTFLLLMIFPLINNIRPEVGEEYQILGGRIDLKGLEGSDWELLKFRVKESDAPEEIGILVVGNNISADVFELELYGRNGELITTFVKSKGYSVGTVRYKKILKMEKDVYKIMMNGQEIEGELYVYLNRERDQ
jgi:membrane-associated protease RseP (regulator of RpoE activity)